MAKDFRCVCDPPLPDSELSVQCTSCSKHQHQLCMQNSVFLRPYECPACQIAAANPALEVCDFVIPPRKIDGVPVFIPYTDNLSDRKVFVRCLKLTIDGHCTEWPSMVTIKLNGEVTSKGANKVEITDISASMPGPGETLQIEFEAAQPCTEYLWSVAAVRRRTSEEVYQLVQIHEESREDSLNLLFPAGSKEVKVDILPAHERLLPHPVRGFWCQHFQCFDLKQFVEERVRKRTPDWKCPVCGKSCFLFKFDRLQNQFQTQFTSAASIYLSRHSPAVPALGKCDPQPRKRPRLSTDPVRLLSFEDFLTGRVEEEGMWGNCGFEGVWAEMESRGDHCACELQDVRLEEGDFSVTKVDIPIEID